ncbi:hypothetical protein SELMODRAFT_444888 [Selaginella moellendorffii]|uniref:Uncharacterized protein n=1 Tax=Selaginella moellendorffii TaxID=88036 RepID=D8SDS2_SELML|nr:uncharacterized protein LOC9647776 [Selaginella moellendorffii]EFJ17390.1 hypothetical protein SELMODRAFT_444888 [Selaginella moellendorffii]|eukprot:XP_002981575.1 uncharacterized protein LOC9647776 [Selaginella moellendorffii]
MASGSEPMPVDGPIFSLERQIEGVEKQICEAEEQLKATNDAEEERYWRKREKQLRQKENQLRRKENQLREEKLILLKAPSAPTTDSDVQGILDHVWNQIHRADRELLEPSDLKASYPDVCIGTVPQAPGSRKPCLLWHCLEEPFRASKYILDQVDIARPGLVVLFDVSGSGKTRTLYEIAVDRLALYFVGVPMGRIGSEGSADLDALVSRLMVLYPGNQSIPMGVTRCCFKAVLLSRFFILDKLKEVAGSMPPQAWAKYWLFKQVGFALRAFQNDPFYVLSDRLLELVSSDCGIEGVFDRLIKTHKREWRGPIILDECQVVQDTLVNRFDSPTAGSRTGSLLDVFVPALFDAGFRTSTFYYSGTGGSMVSVARNISATFKQRLSVTMFCHFGGFYEEADLKDYASRILKDTSQVDFHRVFQLYKGRYRFFVSALESFISEKLPLSKATAYFVEYANLVSTTEYRPMAVNTLGRRVPFLDKTVYRSVKDFFRKHPLALEKLSLILFHQFYGLNVAVKNPSLSLIQYGLARLDGHRRLEMQDLDSSKEGSDTANVLLRIEEPLVLHSLWHYLTVGEPAGLSSIADTDYSGIGQGYEMTAVEMIAKAMDGMQPANLISSFLQDGVYTVTSHELEIPEIYTRRAKLVKPRIHTEQVAQMRHDHRKGSDVHDVNASRYTLQEYINAVKERDVFPSVLWTGESGFGPDALFFLDMSEGDGGGQGQVSETDTACSTSQQQHPMILIPVLVQVKTSKTLDQGTVNNAFYTLDLNKLFQHKSTPTPTEVAGANSLRELACNGCIKLVVSTDFVNLEQQLWNLYLREEACSSRASIKRGEKKDLSTKALLGVIGKDNILAFVDSWLFEAMFVLKDAI